MKWITYKKLTNLFEFILQSSGPYDVFLSEDLFSN